MTRQPHSSRSVCKARSTIGSSSMTRARPPAALALGTGSSICGFCTIGCMAASGTVMVNSEPEPTTEWTSTGWSSRWAKRRTMARPRPRPCLRSRSAFPIWTNSAKISSMWSPGMPMPVSTTAILMVSPERRHLIETVPVCVYRMAFSTRFRMMRASRAGSVSTAQSTAVHTPVQLLRFGQRAKLGLDLLKQGAKLNGCHLGRNQVPHPTWTHPAGHRASL